MSLLTRQFAQNVGAGVQHSAPEPEISTLSEELHAAIRRGWKPTYRLLFGAASVDNLARHHRESIRWHWAARHRVCKGTRRSLTSHGTVRWSRRLPKYKADFPMWSRGHAKSTSARRIAIVDAIIEIFYGRSGYCLYLSGTDEKTSKHAVSILVMLQSPTIRAHAPMLCSVRRSDEGGKSLGWKATFLYTASGHVFHFGSLQSGLAGGNIDEIRPTMIIPDDIDDRKQSLVIAKKNETLFTTEILPMGADGTLTYFAQNLINVYSIMYKIYNGMIRVLVDRRPSAPVPAITDLKTEQRTVPNKKGHPIVQDVIVGGTPTWEHFSIEKCQNELNRIGLPAFLKECQHKVEGTREKAMIHTYRDSTHVISTSEFASVFGAHRMPKRWRKEWGNDWARTKTEYHANVAAWRTVSPRRGPLPGFEFMFYPMSFKENAQPEDVAERVLSCLEEFAIKRAPGSSRPSRTWSDIRNDELRRANALEHTKTSLDRIDFERAAVAKVIAPYGRAVLAEHNVVGGVNSHERDDIRELYADMYGMPCDGVNPGKWGGVEQLNRILAIDMKTEHPFRPGVMGFTRWFMVVPDDLSQTPRIANGVAVYPPKPYPKSLEPAELHDDDLCRFQFVNWEKMDPKLLESGEKIDDPVKANDDFGNMYQMFLTGGSLQNEELSIEDEMEILVPESVKPKPREDGLSGFTIQQQQMYSFHKNIAADKIRAKYGEDVFDDDLEDTIDEYDPDYDEFGVGELVEIDEEDDNSSVMWEE